MLIEELFYTSKKVTAIDYNNVMNKPNFFNLFEDENEIECIKSNNKILKSFYIFIIIITKNFLIFENNEGEKKSSNIERKSSNNERKSSNNERKSSDSESKSNDSERNSSDSERISSDSESIPESRIPSFAIDINEEENFQMEDNSFQMEDKIFQMEEKNFQMKDKYSQLKIKLLLAKKSGQIFRKKFMKTSKYHSFVIKYCQNNEANDINKIPYKFINEFIYYSNFYFCEDLKEIFFLKIIDQFYGKIKLLDFEETSYKMQEIEIKQQEKKGKKAKIK